MSKATKASGSTIDRLREIAAAHHVGPKCATCQLPARVLADLDELLAANAEARLAHNSAIIDTIRRQHPQGFPSSNQTVMRHARRCRGLAV